MAAPDGPAKILGRQIYEYLLERATRVFTYADLQASLRLAPGSTFNTAVSWARKLASQDGNCVAFCWRDGDELVLTANPTDEQLSASVARRGKAINGQVVNFVDQLEWGARNAKDPLLRRYCAQAARAHAGAAMMTDALNDMATDLLDSLTG